MKTISWYQQDETTDEEGFYFQPPTVYESERRILEEDGCPDTHKIEFLWHEPEDRDDAILYATVPDNVFDWMKTEGWGDPEEQDHDRIIQIAKENPVDYGR